MKDITIKIHDPASLNSLNFLNTEDKGFWLRGEEHEGMIYITNMKNNLSIYFTFEWKFKDILVRFLVENLYLWPHPNCYKNKDWTDQDETRRIQCYGKILNEKFVKSLESASKQVEGWPLWKRTILGTPPPPSQPPPENITYNEYTQRPID